MFATIKDHSLISINKQTKSWPEDFLPSRPYKSQYTKEVFDSLIQDFKEKKKYLMGLKARVINLSTNRLSTIKFDELIYDNIYVDSKYLKICKE